MRKFLFLISFFFLFLPGNSQHITKPYPIHSWAMPVDSVDYSPLFINPGFSAVVFPESRAFGEVKQFEKLELGIQLNEELTEAVNIYLRNGTKKPNINPFDPEQISVEATFSCNGKEKKVYAFYYKEYVRDFSTLTWKEDTTSFPWRIRFSPADTGVWKCVINIHALSNQWQSYPFFFQCTESGKKGFVTVRKKDKETLNGRYLTFSKTGETFFPLGINMDWPGYVDNNSPKEFIEYYHQKNKIPLSTVWGSLQAHQYQYYNLWMKKLKESGGNFIAVAFVPWGHMIEEKKMNDYSAEMTDAWEIDHIINKSRELDIYVSFLFSIHPYFQKTGDWLKNPYHSSNQKIIPGITEPIDFFKNQEARKYYKKQLRYFIARWGYSTQVLLWEILSEIDAALADHHYLENKETRKILLSWFDEMYAYIKNDLDDPHLISGSYAVGETRNIDEKIFVTADVSMLHRYGKDKDYNYNVRFADAEKLLKNKKTKNKPVIHDEMGLGGPCPDFCTDIGFHTNIWATSFMGTFGCGLNWWWDNAIFINGYEKHFLALSEFIKGEDFASENYSACRYKNATRMKRAEVEAYYLTNGNGTKAIGWLHNTTYNWYNVSNSCIDSMLINNNGKHIDKPDNTPYKKEYEKNNGEGHFTDYDDLTIKIEGLLKKRSYTVEWFFTTGKGGTTGVTVHVKANSRGIARIKIPEKLSEYGDAAFKMKQVPAAF